MVKGKFPNGLDEAMTERAIGTTALARLLEENKQNVDRWRKGERKLTPEVAAKIARHLEVSPNRLLLLDEPSYSPGPQSFGSALRQARRQRGTTIRQIADAAGCEISDVEAWESTNAKPSNEALNAITNVLNVEAEALLRGEVVATNDTPLGDAVFVSGKMPPHSGPRDVEKLGVVAAGEEGDFEFNGKVAEFVPRPQGLVGRPGVFALELISDSMYPAWRKGDIVFCDRAEPQVGDDVVIEQFPDAEGAVGRAFIKRLKRRSASSLIVEQFNPPQDLSFDPYAIKHLWRVVPNRELHGY